MTLRSSFLPVLGLPVLGLPVLGLRVLGALALAVSLTACASNRGGGATNPNAGNDGPQLRLAVGEVRSQARLVLEVDPRQKPVGPATLHTFNLNLEERTVSVDDSGAKIEARLVEAVGASGEPKLSDQLALALDDLKISFRRTRWGAVQGLRIEGVHPPLDPPTARAVVFTLFGAGRGATLPLKSVGVQDDWTLEATDEIVGLTAHVRMFYTLLDKRSDVLRIRGKGKIEAIGSVGATRRRVNGESYSDEIFDLQKGTITSGEYEWNIGVDDDPFGELPGVGRTRVRAERGLAAQPLRKR